MMNIGVKFAFLALLCSAVSVRSGRDSLGDEEFDVDVNSIFLDNYVKEHSDVIRLPSGVLYRVLREGAEGAPHVTPDQACALRYIGTTLTGDVFISSNKKGTLPSDVLPSSLTLPGWREALSLMKEGDHWEIVLPAHLAYGTATATGSS